MEKRTSEHGWNRLVDPKIQMHPGALLAGRFEDEISNLESSIFGSKMFCSLSTVFSFDIS